MKEVELHPSQIVKERGTSTRLGCLSRCDGSAVLMSELGSCCVGIIGPVEAKEKDQDPIKMICQVTLHPPSGKNFGKLVHLVDRSGSLIGLFYRNKSYRIIS